MKRTRFRPEQIAFRLSPLEKQLIESAARDRALSAGTFARFAAIQLARAQNRDAQSPMPQSGRLGA